MSITKYFKPSVRARILTNDPPAWLARCKRAAYIRTCIVSCPPWSNRAELYALAETARAVSKATGEKHVLDHIVPVTHPYVCGLTVPWNLRIVPWRVNATKSNDFHPDQPDLFIDAVAKGENYELI